MARFFFHVTEGVVIFPDDEGLDFSSVEKAKREALTSLADLLRDAAVSTRPFQTIRLIVTDAEGRDVAAFSVTSNEGAARLN